jgi:hypothetical protein
VAREGALMLVTAPRADGDPSADPERSGRPTGRVPEAL